MAKCANCENTGLYRMADPGVNPVNYCNVCLPPWLRTRADEGHFLAPDVDEDDVKITEEASEEEEESEEDESK